MPNERKPIVDESGQPIPGPRTLRDRWAKTSDRLRLAIATSAACVAGLAAFVANLEKLSTFVTPTSHEESTSQVSDTASATQTAQKEQQSQLTLIPKESPDRTIKGPSSLYSDASTSAIESKQQSARTKNRSFDRNSPVIAGIRDRRVGFQKNSRTSETTHGQSFEFLLYAQPTSRLDKEPLVVDRIDLVVDYSAEDVEYTFPIGPQELTHVHEYSVLLNSRRLKYEVSDDVFRLEEGDFDAFRVLLDSEEHRKYIVHLEIIWWRPSAPGEKHVFRSREYDVAFPEVRDYRELFAGRKSIYVHAAPKNLGEAIAVFKDSPEAEVRVLIPGFSFLRPDKSYAATAFSITMVNPFYAWWKANPAAVRPGHSGVQYTQGMMGRPYFDDNYVIIDESLLLVQDRGRNATLVKDEARVNAVLAEFKREWQRKIDYADLESVSAGVAKAIKDQEPDETLAYWLRHLPYEPSVRVLAYGVASSHSEVRKTSLESLDVIGLLHEEGALRTQAGRILKNMYSDDNVNTKVKAAIRELAESKGIEIE